MSFVMTAGAFDRQACIGEGDVCPEGQRCEQVDGNNTFKCVPHQGIRVARATFRMNANMENIENPWQSTALQLGTRDWSMRWAAGQTLVTWIEEESPRLPMRMNLGEFSLDALFCQDRGDSCASVYDDIAGARDDDGDGISEVRDCDDADARILLRQDGVLCHPYEDVFGPLDHLRRDWIGTIQLAGIDTYWWSSGGSDR